MAAPKYLKNNAGAITEQAAAVVSTADSIVATDASGMIDLSFLPTGVGPDTVSVLASENLAAGAYVNVYSNAGTANVRNADASTTGKEANGFVNSAFLSGATALVYLDGLNTGVTGLTVGEKFLSTSTPGATQTSAPTVAGQIIQKLGIAVTATKMQFTRQQPIVLA